MLLMKTNNQLPMMHTYLAGFAVLLTLFGISTPAHALSCLNPTEMIDDYVTDERFNIARVVAGTVETEGDEHDQAVTVTENLKGTTDGSVSFSHHETWDYLCAGSPVETGSEAVYITNEGTVVQVVRLDSPLYDSLMAALSEEPEEEPATETEVKRTLMQKVIGLLQQMLSLLQSDATPPVTEPAATPEELIGMSTANATTYAETNDLLFRVVEIDGVPQPTTKDYRPGRINATIENDVVVSYTVEGEETTEEVAGAHDELIGMTQTEAESYATENDVAFRIGRIDDQYLPVTMDYRPGRITAEIEADVVVDYSVE